MEGLEALLDVRTSAHFLGGAQEDADFPGVDGIKERLLLCVGIGVMDISDFLGRNTSGYQVVAHFVIDVEPVGVGRGEVAKDKLGGAFVFRGIPGVVDAGHGLG